MAQGTRRRWIRVATTGFGVVLCTGLVGCMNWDKPKDTRLNKQPTPGLPGTPTLPPNNTGAANRIGQPGAGAGFNTQQTGFGTAGVNTPSRVGSTGLNTNTSGTSQPYNFPAQPGNPGMISAPAQPGIFPSVQPVGAAPGTNTGGVSTAGYNPPVPSLALDGPLPPPAPPMYGSSGGSDFAGGVQPPKPLAPLGPAPVSPGAAPISPIKGGF